MTSLPRHVIIAGAGLGGPALALSLARHGIRVTIFEIRDTPSTTGGSITFAANSLRALTACAGQDLYQKIKSTGFVYESMGMWADDGYRFGQLYVGDQGDGFPAVRILRTALHKVIMTACDEAENVKILFGKTMVDVKEEEKGVRLDFEDGSSATGDLLVGADGIHSKVRGHVLGERDPTPEYTGTIVVNGFVPRDKVKLPDPSFTIPATIVSAAGLLMTIPIEPDGNTLAWGITQTHEVERDRKGWEEYQLSGDACRDAKSDFDDIHTEPIRSLLDNVDDTKARLWAPYSIPEIPTWHKGRICLLGDAAHALPPNGQGTAMAFEDAQFLSRLIVSGQGSEKGYDKLFARYEQVRRSRVNKVRDLSAKVGGAIKSKTDPEGWSWWLKKWGMWGYVTVWNRGEFRMHGFSGYDGDTEDIAV